MTTGRLLTERRGCKLALIGAMILGVAMLPVTGCVAGMLVPLVLQPMAERFGQAQVEKACLDVLSLQAAVEAHAILHNGQPPGSLDEVVPLLVGHSDEVPRDPWGNPYELAPMADGDVVPRVRSLGSDGALGGVGLAADIDSVEAERRCARGTR